MQNSHQIVSLKCMNCGAAMEISDDQASAACSYCETNHLIERAGDVASLKPVMSKVQAELALQRLPRELVSLEGERDKIAATMEEELNQLQAEREAVDQFFMNAEVGLWFRSWAIPATLGLGMGLLVVLLYSGNSILGYCIAALMAIGVCTISYRRFSRMKKGKVEALELETKRRREDIDLKLAAAKESWQQSIDALDSRIERAKQQIESCRSIVD